MAIDVFEYLKPSSMAQMKSFDTYGTIIILVDSHFVVVPRQSMASVLSQS
jgi:hypothetical protein